MTLRKLALTAAALLALGGCPGATSKFEGEWCPANGFGKMTLKDGKYRGPQAQKGAYKVDGDNVTLTNDNGATLALTLQEDGSLGGELTSLKRCR